MIETLKVKIFADGADIDGVLALIDNPLIKGFTTNPTLMHAAGVTDYEAFGRRVLALVGDRPVSFEVFSDEVGEMRDQALELASWGSGVYVKIPVTTTTGASTAGLVHDLAHSGVKLNITALTTVAQVERVAAAIDGGAPAIVSVFAGRVADAGVDPVPVMRAARGVLDGVANAELLWASPREVLNVVQASQSGCDIITMTSSLLAKLSLLGKDLDEFSLETVQMFHRDAAAAGLSLRPAAKSP
jgi:transaldolase